MHVMQTQVVLTGGIPAGLPISPVPQSPLFRTGKAQYWFRRDANRELFKGRLKAWLQAASASRAISHRLLPPPLAT